MRFLFEAGLLLILVGVGVAVFKLLFPRDKDKKYDYEENCGDSHRGCDSDNIPNHKSDS